MATITDSGETSSPISSGTTIATTLSKEEEEKKKKKKAGYFSPLQEELIKNADSDWGKTAAIGGSILGNVLFKGASTKDEE